MCSLRLAGLLVTAGATSVALAGAEIPPYRAISFPKGIAPIADGYTWLDSWGGAIGHDDQRVIVGAGTWYQATGFPISFIGGAGEVWERGANGWTRTGKLEPPDGITSFGEFGCSVAIEGGVAVVGSSRAGDAGLEAGAVFVYHRADDGSWSYAQTVAAATPVFSEEFGSSVALENGLLVVGVPDRSGGGGAGLFQLGPDGLFGPEIQLAVPGATASDHWGRQVGLDGGVLLLSWPGRTVDGVSGAGAVATFALTDESPVFDGILTAPGDGLDEGAGFGSRLSFHDGVLAVASPLWGSTDQGAVHCFRRTTRGWSTVGSLFGSQANESLGRVDVSGDLLVTGSPKLAIDAPVQGASTLYRVGESELTPLATRVGTHEDARFGSTVALANGWWLAYDFDFNGSLRGVRIGDAGGDCDGDGVANAVEVTSGNATDCDGDLVPDACEMAEGDCNGNGLLDVCETAPFVVPSTVGQPAPGMPYGVAPDVVHVFLCRIDVPAGGVSMLTGVGSQTNALYNGADTPCYVAVYDDPNQDGTPDDLQLLQAWSTHFAGSDERFEIPVGPLPVEPGHTLYVALATKGNADTNKLVSFLALFDPYVPGYSYYAAWPADQVDFAAIGANADFQELATLFLPWNVVCYGTFAPAADGNADGVVDACACPGDLDGSGTVDGADLGLLLSAWDTAGADLNGDGTTDGADLGLLLSAWGPCA